jgi:hypothetical protein
MLKTSNEIEIEQLWVEYGSYLNDDYGSTFSKAAALKNQLKHTIGLLKTFSSDNSLYESLYTSSSNDVSVTSVKKCFVRFMKVDGTNKSHKERHAFFDALHAKRLNSIRIFKMMAYEINEVVLQYWIANALANEIDLSFKSLMRRQILSKVKLGILPTSADLTDSYAPKYDQKSLNRILLFTSENVARQTKIKEMSAKSYADYTTLGREIEAHMRYAKKSSVSCM